MSPSDDRPDDLRDPRLDGLAGRHVVGPDGERIGTLTDVYQSTSGAGATFATVATGLFGASSSFFPIDAADLSGDDVVVAYSKDVIRGAPRVEADEDLTDDEEQRLFSYYADAAPRSSAGSTAEPGESEAATLTRSEERLRVGTERVEAGRARLRKHVVTETVTRTVPVSHEQLRIHREALPAGTPLGAGVTGLSELEHEFILVAEQPLVQKDVVPVERIRLDTVTVTGEQTVTEQVRKESFELEEPESDVSGPGSGRHD